MRSGIHTQNLSWPGKKLNLPDPEPAANFMYPDLFAYRKSYIDNRMRTFSALLFFICLLPAPALAAMQRVVDVANGDTIMIGSLHGGDRARVRLHGIACPEMNQPYGQAAKTYILRLVRNKLVDVEPAPQGKDQYGRVVAIVHVPGAGVLQELLLQEGLAWVYPQHCKNCGAWEAMQAQARREKKGLWAGENPVPPWQWRKAQKKK